MFSFNEIQKITETKGSTTKTIETIINRRNQYTRFDTLNLIYDRNGNLKQKGNQSLTYDYKNQLVRYSDADKTVEFRYDPFGRRIAKQVKLSNSQTPHITNFYYEGYRVIEERDGSDNLKRQYIYGSGIDELLSMDIFENGTSKPYYFHHNLIGSITGITDGQGNLIELVEYDPYGKAYFLKPTGNPENPYEITVTSTIGNNYLFQDREYDPETNLYYFRARYYDPELDRFISIDPKGYFDSLNLYQAFNQNPINFIDPYGTIVSIERLKSLEEVEIYKMAIAELYQTELGKTFYEILQNDPRIFYIEFDMKNKASSAAGIFEIEKLTGEQDFESAVIKIFVETLKYKKRYEEILTKGEAILDKEIVSKNEELKEFLRFKGLKDIYQIIAEVMGHEFAHAVEAVKDPSRAVHICKVIKDYETIVKDYLKRHKEKAIEYIRKEKEDVYEQFQEVQKMLKEEEARISYPAEKRIYEEMLLRNQRIKNVSLLKRIVERIKEIFNKKN